MKPGYKTTEFWVTTVTSIITILATLGLLSQEEAQTLQQTLVLMVVALVALITNGAVVWRYIDSRTDVKLADVFGPHAIEPADVVLEVANTAATDELPF